MSWGGAYGQHLGNLAPFAESNYAESALLTFMVIVKQNVLNQCSKYFGPDDWKCLGLNIWLQAVKDEIMLMVEILQFQNIA